MPNLAKNHKESRKAVCILCLKKGKENLSSTVQHRIRSFLSQDIEFEDPHVPSGICTACRISLTQKEKSFEGDQVVLPKLHDFSKVFVPRFLRSSPFSCNCMICKIARSGSLQSKSKAHPFGSNKKKWGRPSSSKEQAQLKQCPEMPVNSSQRKTSFLHLDNFGKELGKEFSRGCWKSCHLSHQKQEAFTGRNSSFEPAEWATFSSCPRNLNFSTRTSSSHGFYSCPDWHSKPNQSFQQQGSSAGFLFEHRRSKSQSWKEFSTELCRARQDPGEVLHLDERSADEKRRFHWSRCGVLPKPGRVGLVHPWPAQTCSSRVSHQNQPWRWWKLFQGLSSSCQPIQFLTWGEAWRVPQHWCEEDLHHCHRGRHQWNVLQHLPDPGSHQN